jgi:hypothetical protein
LATTDLTVFLNPAKKSPEVDIEAAACIGDRIYWISSHGRNAKGKERESRHRFFATSVAVTNGAVEIKALGNFYSDLVADMVRDPRLKVFGLAGATATPEGHLLIGFRNPVPRGKALLVRLLNPGEVILGKAALFGEPVLLDLGGFGIRSIELWRDNGRYIVVGGASDGTPGSRLYEWSGDTGQPRQLTGRMDTLNPEALALFGHERTRQILVVSDDGTLQIRGQDCKKLRDPNLKRFRAVSVALDGQARHQLEVPATARLLP